MKVRRRLTERDMDRLFELLRRYEPTAESAQRDYEKAVASGILKEEEIDAAFDAWWAGLKEQPRQTLTLKSPRSERTARRDAPR